MFPVPRHAPEEKSSIVGVSIISSSCVHTDLFSFFLGIHPSRQPLAIRSYHVSVLFVVVPIPSSREQIRKENAATGKESSASEAPWGIISVKAQDADYEIPMQPITMMRNALGKEEGGSGVGLDREKYNESVAYWRDHASVK